MRCSSSLLILISTVSVANWASQSDWSFGPGYPGPRHYWTKAFDTQTNVNWSSTEGFVYLEINSARHSVGSVAGNLFIYPGDINGDGAIDVVTSTGVGKKLIWFENDGSGTNWIEHIVDSSTYFGFCGAYPADIDGDNDLDVIGGIHTGDTDSIFWYENLNGLGTEWGKLYLDSLFDPIYLFGGDVDGDFDCDIIAANHNNPSKIEWWENLDGNGTNWQRHMIASDPRWGSFNEIYPVDLDQDNDLDVLGAFNKQNGLIYCENINGVGTSWSVYQFYTDPEYETPQSVDAGDLDGDGDLDVVIVDGSPPLWGRVLWFENLDGSCESWERHFLEDSLPGVNAVRAVDLTNDGYLDILVGSGEQWGEWLVFFYENIGGTGNYFTRRDIDSGYKCSDVRGADIDNDGFTDVFSNNHYGSVFWISLEGELSGSLTSSILDMWGYPEWHNFSWEGARPAGTDMYFQVRGSNDPENMGEWSGNIYDPGSLTGYLDSTYRYIQYSVSMESVGPVGSPVLDLVTFEYDNLGIEEGESGIPVFSVSSNPCYQNPTISFFLADPGIAEVSVYDLSGREVFRVSDEWSAGANSVDVTVPASGTYFARLRSDSGRYSVRFVVLSI